MTQRIGRPRIDPATLPEDVDPRAIESESKNKRAYWRDPEKRRQQTRQYIANRTPEQREHHREVARAWAARTAERRRELARSPHRRAYVKEWRDADKAANPEKVRRQELSVRLKSKYGVPIELYEALLEAQGGVCAVCRNPETIRIYGTLSILAVDHDHSCCPGKKSCGKCVRGLLCSRCNRIGGHAGDDPALLRAVADYIEAFTSGS